LDQKNDELDQQIIELNQEIGEMNMQRDVTAEKESEHDAKIR